MSSKHHKTLAKEIVDQTRGQFEKQRKNHAVTQPQSHAQEFEQTSKKFEPTPSFSKVFSETVGKRTRRSVNIKLKENPRLINLSEKNTQQSEENKTEHIARIGAQESEQEPTKKLEPTANFSKVFSEIVGKKPSRV